jgi:hypothetical protein
VTCGGPGPERCHRRRAAAVTKIPRNRAAYRAGHFADHVRSQLREAIDRHGNAAATTPTTSTGGGELESAFCRTRSRPVAGGRRAGTPA